MLNHFPARTLTLKVNNLLTCGYQHYYLYFLFILKGLTSSGVRSNVSHTCAFDDNLDSLSPPPNSQKDMFDESEEEVLSNTSIVAVGCKGKSNALSF